MADGRTSPLKKAAASVAAAVSELAAGTPAEPAVLPAPPRPGEHYILELEGETVGAPARFEGGHPYLELLPPPPATRFARKRLGPVRFENLQLDVGLDMAPGFWSWLGGALGPEPFPRDGAVTTVDGLGKVLSRTAFFGATIDEVRFPALDAASREAAVISLIVATPRAETTEPGEDAQPMAPAPPGRRWGASKFRLRIDGLDEALANATRIGPLTVRCGSTAATGTFTVTLPVTAAEPLAGWHRETLQTAGTRKRAERDGALVYLAADLSTPLATLALTRAGIVSLKPEPHEGRTRPRALTTDLYVESVRLEFAEMAV